ncbi:MAG: dephospho-CoA kinase [Rhodoferax sp.]|nr:dephospho-CoA kinase [Rhodoferax sp.]
MPDDAMLRLGLTGGIGSGKSTVANLLRSHGASLIDADAISRSTTGAGGSAIALITLTFGKEFLTNDGALDRDRMRHATFADPQIRERLESIIHPLVGKESTRQEAVAVAAGVRSIVFDIPLLVESRRWRKRVDAVLVVDCVRTVQIERVMARSGLDKAAVERIIDSQASRGERLRAADMVLFNSGTLMSTLMVEVDQLVQRFGL